MTVLLGLQGMRVAVLCHFEPCEGVKRKFFTALWVLGEWLLRVHAILSVEEGAKQFRCRVGGWKRPGWSGGRKCHFKGGTLIRVRGIVTQIGEGRSPVWAEAQSLAG